MSKIKWKVSEEPCGRYRSFEKRRWPQAWHKDTERALFSIDCPDEYSNGKPPHQPLVLRAAKRTDEGRWRWVTLKRRFDSLRELKEFAAQLFEHNPEWFE